jgi:hypothetical protein
MPQINKYHFHRCLDGRIQFIIVVACLTIDSAGSVIKHSSSLFTRFGKLECLVLTSIATTSYIHKSTV